MHVDLCVRQLLEAVLHYLGGALLLLAAAIGWHGARANAATQGDAQGSG